MIINWMTLLRRAELARDRIEVSDGNELEYGRLDAIDSIVMSVIAIEAFINEVTELALESRDLDPDIVKSLGRVLKESEASNASLKLKYMLTYQVLSGQTYDASKEPFQDMHLLIELRNAIVHYKPLDKFESSEEGNIVQKPVRILSKLESKKILSNVRSQGDLKYKDKLITSWLYEISTKACAVWACRISEEVIKSTIAIFPDGHLKRILEEPFWMLEEMRK